MIPTFSQLNLNHLNDFQLSQYIGGISSDLLLLSDGIEAKTKLRILKVCDAEKARVLLSTCIQLNPKFQYGANCPKYICTHRVALLAMSEPERLPIFKEAVEQGREVYFDKIPIEAFLEYRDLPEALRKILEVEKEFLKTHKNRGRITSKLNDQGDRPLIDGRNSNRLLEELSDKELENYINGISTEQLLQLALFNSNLIARILKSCDAEKVRALLSRCIRRKEDQLDSVCTSDEALRVMDEPNRLPVFIDALKQGRNLFIERIDVELFLTYPFLPRNIKGVLEIEVQLYKQRHTPLTRENRQRLIEKCDRELSAAVL